MSRATMVRAAGAAAVLGGLLYLLSMATHPNGLARAIVPGSIVGMLLGVVGLHARLWGHEGRLGLWGFGLAGAGLALGFVGMAGSAVGILSPNPLALMINTGEHAGLAFIGAGLLLWGIVALRERALGRWSVLPVLMSLLGLPGFLFIFPDAFAAVEHSVLPYAFAIGWLLLGVALLASRPKADLTPSPIH